jgi:hypothetical protein
MNKETQFKPIPDGVKTPKMIEVEQRIGRALEHDYGLNYLDGPMGQKRLANRWRVPRAMIFGPLAGGRRSWVQKLDLPKKGKPSAPERCEQVTHRCEICETTKAPLERAHWIARGDGGPSSQYNILKLCRNCHGLLHHHDETTTRRACEILVWRAAESFVSKSERGAELQRRFLELCLSITQRKISDVTTGKGRMKDTVEELKVRYEHRVVALLQRWREACLAKNWPTSEVGTGFHQLPGTGNTVYSWSFDTDVELNRKAHVEVILEGETALDDDEEFVAVVDCFSWITFGIKGSDVVKWGVPTFGRLHGDDNAFEHGFRSLEDVDGAKVVAAIERHIINEG